MITTYGWYNYYMYCSIQYVRNWKDKFDMKWIKEPEK